MLSSLLIPARRMMALGLCAVGTWGSHLNRKPRLQSMHLNQGIRECQWGTPSICSRAMIWKCLREPSYHGKQSTSKFTIYRSRTSTKILPNKALQKLQARSPMHCFLEINIVTTPPFGSCVRTYKCKISNTKQNMTTQIMKLIPQTAYLFSRQNCKRICYIQ